MFQPLCHCLNEFCHSPTSHISQVLTLSENLNVCQTVLLSVTYFSLRLLKYYPFLSSVITNFFCFQEKQLFFSDGSDKNLLRSLLLCIKPLQFFSHERFLITLDVFFLTRCISVMFFHSHKKRKDSLEGRNLSSRRYQYLGYLNIECTEN